MQDAASCGSSEMNLTELSKADWEKAAEETLKATPTSLFIGGELVEAARDERVRTALAQKVSRERVGGERKGRRRRRRRQAG